MNVVYFVRNAGKTYQQYQKLENPKKTNPTLEILYRLQIKIASNMFADFYSFANYLYI